MIPIFQTLVDPGKGNCMQAVYASLFDLPLEVVPNFILWLDDDRPDDRHWGQVEHDFIKSQGCRMATVLCSPYSEGAPRTHAECLLPAIKDWEGLDGYFYATVHSPKYWKTGGKHCVVVDKNLNIVHDPCPDYQDLESYPHAEKMGHNGINQVKVIQRQDEGVK